jgi:tRNA (cmo5U34)-methyltransferase
MTTTDTIFRTAARSGDFAFDARVASVFDDMVSRSVPYYDHVQSIQAQLAVAFLPREECVLCDLGCSTGTTIAAILEHPDCPPSARFIGVDNSADMLAQAETKLAQAIADGRVTLLEADLNAGPELPSCRVMLMNWSLQFVRPIYRERLVQSIQSVLDPEGALFLSEKILVSDSRLNRTYIDLYLRYKKAQGYTDEEIQRKREALENVLVPYRIEENVELLHRCGFGTVDVYFRWLNFASLVAIK